MKEILSNIAILCASFAGVVAALDFMLSESFKKKANELSISAWYKISKIDVWKKVYLYRSNTFYKVSFIYGTAAFGLLFSLVNFVGFLLDEYNKDEYKIMTIGCLIASIVAFFIHKKIYSINFIRNFGTRIHNWTMKGDAVFYIFLKSIIIIIALALLNVLLDEIYSISFNDTNYISLFVFILIFAILFLFSMAIASASMIIQLLMLRIILGYLLILPLYIIEQVLRRIAEYDKGAILGVAALAAGIGAILKIF